MYTIRPYEEKDRVRVEAVCQPQNPETAGEPGSMERMFAESLIPVFCQYYVEREPQNCFVAVNEQDEAVGYVLCAANFTVWEKDFTELYLEKTANPVTQAMGKATIEGLRPFSGEYPAHLHIDLAEGCQRQGLGTRLMDTLLAHLKNQGVPGVALSVARDNENGLNFYRKYGFLELGRSEQEITMGKKLG